MKAPSAIARRIGLRREQQQQCRARTTPNLGVFLSLLTAGDGSRLRWVASESHHKARNQPQNGQRPRRMNPLPRGGNLEQPQTAATAGSKS